MNRSSECGRQQAARAAYMYIYIYISHIYVYRETPKLRLGGISGFRQPAPNLGTELELQI